MLSERVRTLAMCAGLSLVPLAGLGYLVMSARAEVAASPSRTARADASPLRTSAPSTIATGAELTALTPARDCCAALRQNRGAAPPFQQGYYAAAVAWCESPASGDPGAAARAMPELADLPLPASCRGGRTK